MNATDHCNAHPDVLRVVQSKEQTRSFYNRISKIYDLMAERAEEPVRKAGLDALAVRTGETVLEIGFGTGHCLVALANAVGRTGKVYGIDLSEGMYRRTLRLLKQKRLAGRVELACGDAVTLPYDSDTIDCVFTSFTLELFDTPEIPKVLTECKRVLRPGGRIVIVGMSKEQGKGFEIRALEWIHRHFPNSLDCRPIFVRRSLEAAGFEIIDEQLTHMWVPVEIVSARKRHGHAPCDD